MGDSLCPQGIKKGFSEEVTFEGRVSSSSRGQTGRGSPGEESPDVQRSTLPQQGGNSLERLCLFHKTLSF